MFSRVASQVPSSERHSYHPHLKYQDPYCKKPEVPVVSRMLECKSLLLFSWGKMLSLSALPSVTVLSRNMWETHTTGFCFVLFCFFWPHCVAFGIPVLQRRMECSLPHCKHSGIASEPRGYSPLQVNANILRHIKKLREVGEIKFNMLFNSRYLRHSLVVRG